MTGYTQIIANKEDVTLKEFTLQCARAFGACVQQRDEDMSVPPRKLEVSTFHTERLKKLKKTPRFSQKEFHTWQSEQIKYYNKQITEKQLLIGKLEKMLNKVFKWSCPSKLNGLKAFMVSQLKDTIKHESRDYYTNSLKEVQGTTFSEWKTAQLESHKYEIKYHTEELKKEKKQIAEQNEWIDVLYNSLDKI